MGLITEGQKEDRKDRYSMGIVEQCQNELCVKCPKHQEKYRCGVIDGYGTWIDEHSGYDDDEPGEPNVWASEERARSYLYGHCDKVNEWLRKQRR